MLDVALQITSKVVVLARVASFKQSAQRLYPIASHHSFWMFHFRGAFAEPSMLLIHGRQEEGWRVDTRLFRQIIFTVGCISNWIILYFLLWVCSVALCCSLLLFYTLKTCSSQQVSDDLTFLTECNRSTLSFATCLELTRFVFQRMSQKMRTKGLPTWSTCHCVKFRRSTFDLISNLCLDMSTTRL